MALKNWVEHLQAAEKEKQRFLKHGREAYRAWKGEGESNDEAGGVPYEFNLFWANVGVLKSALYANPPTPLVKREFDDYQDDAARVAGIMMERMLDQDLCSDAGDTSNAITMAVDDKLIAGLGQVWLRYEPTIEEFEMEEALGTDGQVLAAAQTVEELTDEQVITDYVYWEDFFWSPARVWKEVWWLARRIWLTKSEATEEFGAKAAETLEYGSVSSKETAGTLTPTDRRARKAEIFEVWNKRNKTVCFYSRDGRKSLKNTKDPLGIPGFWPCPQPLASNIANGNYMPKPDYKMVRSQYMRIEMLSNRLFLLEEAVRVAGVYDKANSELQQLLSEGSLNKMIPVDNWALLAEKGGLAGSVDWFPVQQVVEAIGVLRAELGEANKQLYELIGISDIMRGTTAPRETLGAQQMKAQYSSTRLQYQQKDVGKFVSAILKIKAHIISQHFSPQTIIKRSNIMLTPDADVAAEATQLLKDQWSVCYRLTIETDQMAIPDYNAERQGRIELITASGQFISQVMPLVQAEPQAAPFFLEILKWGIASFRTGSTIEGVFDKAIKGIVKKVQQPPPPPPPDPKMVKAQADVQANNAKTKASIQRDDNKAKADINRDQIKTQADIAQDWQKVNAQIAQMNRKDNADD